MEKQPIIVERVYNAPIEKVWKAITDSEEMKQWYFNLPGFKAEVGYEFQFEGGPDPSQPYTHLCKVTEVIEGRKIAYTWRYKGYAGNSLVSFELFPEGQKTRLRLTHENLDTFPSNNPDLARGNFVQGWDHIINKSLTGFVEATKTI